MLDKQAKIAHRAVDVVCGLFFAVDKDLSHLPEKRTRTGLSTERQHHTTPQIVLSEVKIPDTVHPGYGELTYPALQKLFHYLCELAPAPLRLQRQCSSFLDAGSGFGKAVLHAAIRGQIRRSVGIEYVPVRHRQANLTLQHLLSGRVPGLVDTESVLPRLSTSSSLHAVELIEGDVSDPQHYGLLHSATHIYCFDVLFGKRLMQLIIEQVRLSPRCLVFLSYHPPHQVTSWGLAGWSCIDRIPGRTTGKQRFTCHVYVNPLASSASSPSTTKMSFASFAELPQLPQRSPSYPDDVESTTDVVLPSSDHNMTRCALCGKKCSPTGVGGQKRVFISDDWKQRMSEDTCIKWSMLECTVVHDGCRCRIRRMRRVHS